jgi:imidazolonepropionase-like amidohydrolase
MKRIVILIQFLSFYSFSQNLIYLKPDRIFDGEKVVINTGVLISGDKIVAVGSFSDLEKNLPKNTQTIDLKGHTLLPGLVEGHSHLFLHPYNETSWNDQVLKESRSYRMARAVKHAEATLKAGFTTVRDLGTEGAEYDDVGLKKAINEGIILGPKMLIATKGIVATGSYGPKYSPDIDLPQGAEEGSGIEELTKVVRSQIGKGADLIKVYADYRWGLKDESKPTFTLAELTQIVEVTKSSGRPVVAHASTAEGMKRAILAGIETIEHGDNGTPEIWKLMVEKNVALCPTLAAGDATTQYKGWKKGIEPEPEKLANKRKTFAEALKAGVKICFGGDVGVFAHGDNARELIMMVDYGMPALNALKSATSTNSDVFHIANEVGRIKPNLLADLLIVEGNPTQNIQDIRKVKMVFKNGVMVKLD